MCVVLCGRCGFVSGTSIRSGAYLAFGNERLFGDGVSCLNMFMGPAKESWDEMSPVILTPSLVGLKF